MRAQLDTANVIKANAQFWEQMLATTLKPMSSAEQFCAGAGHLRGSVALAGAWTGRIEVRMTGALAYQATAAMLMQALDTVTAADVLDATREMANMIAGTLKSSLPRPCSMSIPESAVEPDGFAAPAPAQGWLMVAFRHEAGELMVGVWELQCTEGAAA